MRLVMPLLAALALALPALAQDSPAQLRRQIDQLSEQIAELQAEVERANERIEKLLDENRRLREALRENRNDSDTDLDVDVEAEEERLEIPEDPFAAPIAMRAYIAQSWAETFGDVQPDPDNVDTRYLRALRRWASDLERDLRDDFTWRVYVERAEEQNREVVAVVQILNAGRPLGEPTRVTSRGAAGALLLAAAKDAVIIIDGRTRVNLDVSVQHGVGDELVAPYVMLEEDYEVNRARYE